MVSIRKAIDSDLQILYGFQQGIVEAERPFDPTLKGGILHYYDLSQVIRSDKALVLVAEENGEILGAGSAEIRPAKEYLVHSHYVYLGFMFTRPEARGKGVNKKILDELMNWARTKGIEEIRLEVYAGNAVARQAYEKAGFKDHLIEMRFGSGESLTSI